MSLLGNVIGYQLVWFTAVWGASRGLAWPAVIAALLFAAWQLAISRERGAEVRLVLVAIALGVVLDGALAATDLVRYAAASPALPPGGAPVWILALWVAFALTLNRSLGWLTGKPLVSLLLGAIGGPLAYRAAGKLGAASLSVPRWHGLLALAVGWAVATMLLTYLAAAWLRAARASRALPRLPDAHLHAVPLAAPETLIHPVRRG